MFPLFVSLLYQVAFGTSRFVGTGFEVSGNLCEDCLNLILVVFSGLLDLREGGKEPRTNIQIASSFEVFGTFNLVLLILSNQGLEGCHLGVLFIVVLQNVSSHVLVVQTSQFDLTLGRCLDLHFVARVSLLGNAESFIRNNSKNPWTIRGMRREEKSDYPFKAVREVLVNAMIHRDYQIIGTEIHVDMFDDRLEITSPGGMLSGGRIQEMDLRRLPSMRRNEIISDIFGRLHYMDRRGSGIGRILNSYTEFAEKPQFYSDEYYFLVVLPNRSVAEPAQTSIDLPETQSGSGKTQLSDQKTQPGSEKTQLAGSNAPIDQDWELSYFRDVLLQYRGVGLRQRTLDRIVLLFSKYRYNYHFNRRNIADLFSITPNGASGFINTCIEHDIIEKIKTDEYCFCSPNQ